MNLQLFGHPFSSYTWKVLIALWADETPFKFRMLGPDHPENGDELHRRWPFGQFPLLVDGDRSIAEATCIIEHLQAHHPGPNCWIPDGELGRRVRFLAPKKAATSLHGSSPGFSLRKSERRSPRYADESMTHLEGSGV